MHAEPSVLGVMKAGLVTALFLLLATPLPPPAALAQGNLATLSGR